MNDIMVPQNMVTMVSEIDAAGLHRLREKARAAGLPPPSYTAIIIKAVSRVLEKNPQANRAILGPPFFRSLYQFDGTNINVAVEKDLPHLPGMAYAPTIHNVTTKSLREITSELQTLARSTEDNDPGFRDFMRILRRVPSPISNWLINIPYWFPSFWSKYRGCAAWVNAPSKAGADLVMTTWPWPLTFSFGIVKLRPFLVEVTGETPRLEAGLTIPLVLSFDRRIMGGGPASRLFAEFQNILMRADELAD